jgi:hypothetical protein
MLIHSALQSGAFSSERGPDPGAVSLGQGDSHGVLGEANPSFVRRCLIAQDSGLCPIRDFEPVMSS